MLNSLSLMGCHTQRGQWLILSLRSLCIILSCALPSSPPGPSLRVQLQQSPRQDQLHSPSRRQLEDEASWFLGSEVVGGGDETWALSTLAPSPQLSGFFRGVVKIPLSSEPSCGLLSVRVEVSLIKRLEPMLRVSLEPRTRVKHEGGEQADWGPRVMECSLL